MPHEHRFAESAADRAAARRLRDHVAEAYARTHGDDAVSAIDRLMDGETLCALAGSQFVGTMDVHAGMNATISRGKMRAFRMHDNTGNAPMDKVALLDLPIVHPDFSNRPVGLELLQTAVRHVATSGVRYVFAMCEPCDVAAHRAMGFVDCAPAVSRGKWGVYVPMMLDFSDVQRLEHVASPFLDLVNGGANGREAPSDAWREIFRVKRRSLEQCSTLLSSLNRDEADRLLLGSSMVTKVHGEHFIRQGETGHELYFLLSGVVEARTAERVFGVHTAGDVFGEIGYILEIERTADVVVVSQDAKALRITEDFLVHDIERDPGLAARALMGIARGICWKLMRADEHRLEHTMRRPPEEA